MRGALGGMSTGCYAVCWQIELQLKKKKVCITGLKPNELGTDFGYVFP